MGTNTAANDARFIGTSSEPCHYSNILWTDEPWRGRRLFTGPDGVGDHQVTVDEEHRYVGIGAMSREGTSDADYLWRPATGTAFHRPKTSRVGEIGWNVPKDQDWNCANSGRQIMLGHFRQETEDRHSHLYQNAWYPGPNDVLQPGCDADLVMNVYRSKTAHPSSRGSTQQQQQRRSRAAPARGGGGQQRGQYRASDETSQSSNDTAPGQRTENYLAVHN